MTEIPFSPIKNKMMFTHVESKPSHCTCIIEKGILPNISPSVKSVILTGNLDDHIARIKKENAISYWGTGPGTEKYFKTANDQKIFLSTDKNLNLMKKRIVHLASCHPCVDLADALINNGTRTFIGYTDLFYMYYDTESELGKEPCEEPTNYQDYYSLIRSDVEAQISLGNYKNTKEAFDEAQSKYEYFINKYTTGEWRNRKIARKMRRFLQHNKDCMCIKGDLTATIK